MTDTSEYTDEQRVAAAAAWGPVLRNEAGAELTEENLMVLTDEAFFNVVSHWTVRGNIKEAMHIPPEYVGTVDKVLDALGEQPESVTTAAGPMAAVIQRIPREERFVQVVFCISLIALMGGFVEGDVLASTQQFNVILEGLSRQGINYHDFPQAANALELVQAAKAEMLTAGQSIVSTYGPEGLRRWFGVNMGYKFGVYTEAQATEKLAADLSLDPSQISHVEATVDPRTGSVTIDGDLDDSDLGRALKANAENKKKSA